MSHRLREFLPLNAENWITCGNALRLDWSEFVPPTRLNYILGNPPFVPATDRIMICGGSGMLADVRALAEKAHAVGLATHGPITQAEFLGRLGIVERTQRLMAANPGRASEIETAVQRLISPGGMGGLFKVMAIASPHLPPPPPFG